MHTHVAKWGASYVIRLPKTAVETLGLYEGQSVNLSIEDNKLVLEKNAPRYQLNDLVSQMDVGNEPAFILKDDPQGDEIL